MNVLICRSTKIADKYNFVSVNIRGEIKASLSVDCTLQQPVSYTGNECRFVCAQIAETKVLLGNSLG